MTPRLNPLYKKLLLLSLVFGPMVWLLFTTDGQQRSDRVLLALLGKEDLNLAIERLRGDFGEGAFRTQFPALPWRCDGGANPFGDRLCTAEIGTFNGIPARAVTLFFQENRLRALKVNYRRAYHRLLIQRLDARLGRRSGRDAADPSVVTWPVQDGVLLMSEEEPADDGEAALFWIGRPGIAFETLR